MDRSRIGAAASLALRGGEDRRRRRRLMAECGAGGAHRIGPSPAAFRPGGRRRRAPTTVQILPSGLPAPPIPPGPASDMNAVVYGVWSRPPAARSEPRGPAWRGLEMPPAPSGTVRMSVRWNSSRAPFRLEELRLAFLPPPLIFSRIKDENL